MYAIPKTTAIKIPITFARAPRPVIMSIKMPTIIEIHINSINNIASIFIIFLLSLIIYSQFRVFKSPKYYNSQNRNPVNFQ